MGTVGYLGWVELRRGWRRVAALVALVGLSAGVVLAATAGARRTASAFPRMVEANDTGELLVSPNGDGTGLEGFYDEIEALEGVRTVAAILGLALAVDPRSPLGHVEAAGAYSAVDARYGTDVDRPNLIAGRLPRVDRADEVLVNRALAGQGIEVGDRLDLVLVDSDVLELDVADVDEYDLASAVPILATVVGIGVYANEVVPFTDLDEWGWFTTSPALTALARPEHVQFEGAVVDLEPGAVVSDVRSRIEAVAERHTEGLGPDGLFIADQVALAEDVRDSIRPLAVSLGAFAGVTALVALLVVGPAVRRHLRMDERHRASLVALGARGRDLAGLRMMRGAALGLAGSAVAVATAGVLSPLAPIGPARLAEPDPGLALDLPVVMAGVLAVVGLCLGAAAGRRPRAGSLTTAAPPVTRRLARGAARSPAMDIGLRAALSGQPYRRRGVIAGAVVGIAGLTAAATFGSSLDALVGTPARYGQTWTLLLDAQFGAVPAGRIVEELATSPAVAGLAAGTYGEVAIGDDRVAAISWLPVSGDLRPVTVRGEAADQPGEIALGGAVLERLGLDLGDEVVADGGLGPRPFRVVGEMVFPRFGLGSFSTTGLGEGAQVHPDDLFAPGSAPEGTALGPGSELDGRLYNFVVVDVPGGLTAVAGDVAAATEGTFVVPRDGQRPTAIADLGRVRSVPTILAATLALLAAGTLIQSLTTSLRGRRRELGLLKALGFARAQTAATVAWHATAVVVVGLAAGLPVGVAVGRTAWTLFAGGLHLPARPVVPVAAVILTVAGGLVASNLVALPVARAAARVRAAQVLRAE